MFKSLRFWVSLAISALFLVLFFWRVHPRAVLHDLSQANYLYVLPALALYFLAVWFRTLRWKLLLTPLGKLPMRRLYPMVVIGYMANNVLPVRIGEVVRAYYVGERERISKTGAFATIAAERLFDGLTLILFALCSLAFIPIADVLQNDQGHVDPSRVALAVVIGGAFLAALVVAFTVVLSPPAARLLVRAVTVFLPSRFRTKAGAFLESFIRGLHALRDPRLLLSAALISAPVWLCEAAMYYLISFSFDLHLSFALILLLTAASNLVTSLPSTGGGIGPFEQASKVVLVSFGVESSKAVSYIFVLHAALLLPVTLLGFLMLAYANVSFFELARKAPATTLVEEAKP